MGDKDRLSSAVKTLKDTGLPIAGVRDADAGDDPKSSIYCLPGSKPPEKELFECAAVRTAFEEGYGILFRDFTATLSNVDHHSWMRRLAERIDQPVAVVLSQAARSYADALQESERNRLVSLLKESFSV